jgi:hypothetical protein
LLPHRIDEIIRIRDELDAGKDVRSQLCKAPGTSRRMVEPFRQLAPDTFSSPVPATR